MKNRLLATEGRDGPVSSDHFDIAQHAHEAGCYDNLVRFSQDASRTRREVRESPAKA
jgi:hypothetical protein